MKKTLTAVMALVLALSMVASFAFVLNPGTGGAYTADQSPLVITGFFVTTNDAIKAGARLYSALEQSANPAYAKNEVIRFAITMDVLNPLVPSNNVDAAQLEDTAEPVELTVTSSTVDFSISNMAGQQALHVPFSSTFVNAITSKVTNNTDTTATIVGAYGAKVVDNELLLKVKLSDGDTPDQAAFGETDSSGYSVILYAPTGTTAKASYAYIFSGITKGEITEQGLAKLVIEATKGTEFVADKAIKVVKNGRTYYVAKTTEAAVKHPYITDVSKLSSYYDYTKVGYRVYLVGEKDGSNYKLLPVAQLDTESITWADKEVEGLGYSLGLEKLTEEFAVADTLPATIDDPSSSADNYPVFRTVLSDGSVRYILGEGYTAGTTTYKVGDLAFTATELARLNTMLADFGFSTADNYTYKLEDKYFTSAGEELKVLTATYNNGTVVPVETEEETDVEEGTEEEELEEDEDIVEDIDEELEEDDEVPATGDFAADIALALTAAAIVAAAALAFVMKKARD